MHQRAKEIWRVLQHRLLGGNERTARTKKNIIAVILIRGASQATGLFIVPLSLHYLNQSHYGIWLTISSIAGWLAFFDLGIGNSLRNKFTETIARNEHYKTKIYISTSYFILGCISSLLFVLFLLSTFVINWAEILNFSGSSSHEVHITLIITMFAFSIRLALSVLPNILLGDQKPAFHSLLELIINILSCILLIILITFTTRSSLIGLSFGIGSINIGVLFIATWYFFTRHYPELQPSIDSINLVYIKDLISQGIKFLILQVTSIIVFSSSNILISILYSPADVVTFNIAYKYYNIIYVLSYFLLLPFWSAYSEAFAKGDYRWIENTLRSLRKMWYLAVGIILLFTFMANTFYTLWVGKSIVVPMELSFSMALYTILIIWNNIYGNFLNGTGKLQLSLINSLIITVLYIPLVLLLCKIFQLGPSGVILATSLCLLPGAFLWPLQTKKILKGTAAGIWNK